MENGFIDFRTPDWNDYYEQLCVPILGWNIVHEHDYDYDIDRKHNREAHDALAMGLRAVLNYLKHLAIDKKDFEAAKSYRDGIILHDRIRQLVEKEKEQIDNPEEDRFKDLAMGDLEDILYSLDKEQREIQMQSNPEKSRKNLLAEISQVEEEGKEWDETIVEAREYKKQERYKTLDVEDLQKIFYKIDKSNRKKQMTLDPEKARESLLSQISQAEEEEKRLDEQIEKNKMEKNNGNKNSKKKSLTENPTEETDKYESLDMEDLQNILYVTDEDNREKQMSLNYNKARKNIISQILLLQAEKENKEQQLQAEKASKRSNASNPGKKKKRKKGEETEL